MPRHPKSAPVKVAVIAAVTVVVAVAAETAAVAVAAVETAAAVAVIAEDASAAVAKTAKGAVATGPLRMTAGTPATEAGNRALTVAGRTTPQK